MVLYLGYIEHAEGNSYQDDEASRHMLRVVLESHAATSEQHLKRDKELEQCSQLVDRDHIGWPEEEKGVAHVENAKKSE